MKTWAFAGDNARALVTILPWLLDGLPETAADVKAIRFVEDAKGVQSWSVNPEGIAPPADPVERTFVMRCRVTIRKEGETVGKKKSGGKRRGC